MAIDPENEVLKACKKFQEIIIINNLLIFIQFSQIELKEVFHKKNHSKKL